MLMHAILRRQDGALMLSDGLFESEAEARLAIDVYGLEVVGMLAAHTCDEGGQWIKVKTSDGRHTSHLPIAETAA